jgi:hypothetical protein
LVVMCHGFKPSYGGYQMFDHLFIFFISVVWCYNNLIKFPIQALLTPDVM